MADEVKVYDINTISIKSLNETTSVNDDDLLVIEDTTTTHKIKATSFLSYIREKVKDTFIQLAEKGANNGVAPLNSGGKINPNFLQFGKEAGKVYEGNDGKILEDDFAVHKARIDNPHVVTKAQVGLGNVDNKSSATIRNEITAANINKALGGWDPEPAGAFVNATAYTDTKIGELIGGASSTLDTLKEIEDVIRGDEGILESINNLAAKKANQTELDTHTSNNTIHIIASERTKWNDAHTHSASSHARTDATKTENSTTNGNIKINGSEVAVYEHPLSGVNAGTYRSVTVDARGHVTGGTNPTLPITQGGTGATSASGALENLGLTATAAELNKMDGVNVTTAEINQLSGVTSNVQTQINGKAPTSHGQHLPATSTAHKDKLAMCNGTGVEWHELTASDITNALGYVPGTGSNLITAVKGDAETEYKTGNVNITPSSIGLSKVNNTSDNEKSVLSAQKLATARKIGNANFSGEADISIANIGAAATSHTHTKAQITDMPTKVSEFTNDVGFITTASNTATATKLATPRTINGTNFDGSAAITTSNWGTARNIVIGNTTKSVNGSANINYSLSEIGAAPTNHTHNELIPLVTGTQAAVTGTWTGLASSVTSLYDGLTIKYWLPYAGSGNATLNLTLSDGSTTGNIPIYYSTTTRLTTHYDPGNMITLHYRVNANINGTNYTGWWCDVDRNTDTVDRSLFNCGIVVGEPIYSYKIVMQGIDGKFYPLTKETGTGTNKTVSDKTFLIGSPILYYPSTTTLPENQTSSGFYSSYTTSNFHYTANKSSWVAGKAVYLKAYPYVDGLRIDDEEFIEDFITQTLPDYNDGYVYILLGYMHNTTTFKLSQEHPAYCYNDGYIVQYVDNHTHKYGIHAYSHISMGRKSGTSTGYYSVAMGGNTTASGQYSCALGQNTIASGASAHTEGRNTIASGEYSHAEGYNCEAIGAYSHAEGEDTEARNYSSHAEGFSTLASGMASHAEGELSIASAWVSHAEGDATMATQNGSHSEGGYTHASGEYSHAEGYTTTASGYTSHSTGLLTSASGDSSWCGGYSTTAGNYAAMTIGHWNVAQTTGGSSTNTTGHAFVIGKGTNGTKSNAFSVMYSGVVKAASTITASTTADYAEYFEWVDQNPNCEDRVGKFVTLEGTNIRFATDSDSYILGVVSGAPFLLGNADCDTWNGMYLRDEFNRIVYEDAPLTKRNKGTGEEDEVYDSEGNPLYYGTRPKINPDYNPDEPYVGRDERPEWSPIGMLGVLSVYDDGTCEVNGYCKCNNNSIATKSETGYRVIERVTENVVKIVFR